MPILSVENYYTDAFGNTEEPFVQTRGESSLKYPVLGLLVFSAIILIVGIIIGFVLIRKRSKYDAVEIHQSEGLKDDQLFTDNKFDLNPSLIDDEKLPAPGHL